MPFPSTAFALIAIAVSAPAFAAPCAGFTDVDDSSPFCVNVAWMKNRGITLGCDQAQTLYCPNATVTRLQMAAFMYRLGFQNAFLRDGNAFGATAVLGTTDAHPVDIIAAGYRLMRFQPFVQNGISTLGVNILGGHPNNTIDPTTNTQTIAGGGFGGATCFSPLTGTNNRSCANHTGGGGTVSGGLANVAEHVGTVAGGGSNTASGPYSFVAGGFGNIASGNVAVAAGEGAKADQHRCFVFSGWSVIGGISCLGTANVARFGLDHGLSVDYFSRRLDGGGTRWVYIGDTFAGQTIATWTGAFLSDAGVWTNASDVAAKEAFEDIDGEAILEKLVLMPLRSWRYKADAEGVRRMGPTAQDFRAAFGLGVDDKTIATVDADGVALTAIQGLNTKLEAKLAERDAEVATLRAELAAIRSMLATITGAKPTQTAVAGP